MSLIEVVVVLALLALTTMVGVPAMEQWLENYRVRTTAEELGSNIQLQRMRAVARNRDFSIEFDAEGGTYRLWEGLPPDGTLLDVAPRALPDGVAFAGPEADPIEFADDLAVFHADGSINDSTAATDSVFLTHDSGTSYEISVNRTTGRVVVAKLSGS